MKTALVVLFLSLSLASCKKNTNNTPSITTLIPRCEGGTVKSIAIPFNFKTNGTSVIKIELYKSPSTKISEINALSDGTYTLYHSNTTCPKQSDNIYYYFTITKGDNTTLSTTPFQVYF